MRTYLLALLSLLVVGACHKATTTGDDDDQMMGGADANPAGSAAWTVQSTDVMINAGEEITECYYFHTPNTATDLVTAWSSHIDAGQPSHDSVLGFVGSAR